jgi:polyphosphate glucokinase
MGSCVPQAIGIDIGGTGIKTAAVDLASGELTTKRRTMDTPTPATTEAIGKVIARLMKRDGLPEIDTVGAAFPAVIKHGIATTASNIDESWKGADVARVIGEAIGKKVAVLNDADAAALAEVRFGVGRGVPGVIAMVTLGTGIGTALMADGTLLPNTELGHIKLRGKDADQRAAGSARERDNLTWAKWAKNVEEYLEALDRLIWPDLIIIGGGVSAEPENFLPFIHVRPPVVAATLGNNAGIIGAALFAEESGTRPTQARGAYSLGTDE